MKSAILLSGGVDSIAVTYWKRPQLAITVDYGQLCSEAEIQAASQITTELGLRHEILRVDCSALGSGDLVGAAVTPIGPASDWWPFRNQLLATLAGMWAVQMGVTELMFGAVQSDGFHVDGRIEYFSQLNRLMSMQEGGVLISVPAIEMTSLQVVQTSRIPMSLLAWAHSCHKSDIACGNCRGCFKRQAVMSELLHESTVQLHRD